MLHVSINRNFSLCVYLLLVLDLVMILYFGANLSRFDIITFDVVYFAHEQDGLTALLTLGLDLVSEDMQAKRRAKITIAVIRSAMHGWLRVKNFISFLHAGHRVHLHSNIIRK